MSWEKIWGPVGTVVCQEFVGGSSGDIFATKSDMNGSIYVHMPYTPQKWLEIGGPGKMFVCDDLHLYGLSPDGSGVWEHTWSGKKWTKIGGPAAEIYGGPYGLFATNPNNGDIYRYGGKAMKWSKIGGKGKMFVVGSKRVYGLSPDGSGVWRYTGSGTSWTPLGGPQDGPIASIYVAGNVVFAALKSGDIFQYYPKALPMPIWKKIGGPGKMFATGSQNLYGLSPDGSGVWVYSATGYPFGWSKIGGPAASIYAGGTTLCATSPKKPHDLWRLKP